MPRYLFFIFALLVLLPRELFASSCPCSPKSPGEKYSEAHAVFVGRLLRVDEIPGRAPRTALLKFSVEDSFKGMSLPEANVEIPVSINACGLSEERIGVEYLVYASAHTDGTLKTSVCMGTDEALSLEPEIDFLRSIYHPEEHDDKGERFPDVPADHPNASAIERFRDQQFIKGYPDGTFRPDQSVSRVEALKLIVDAAFPYRTKVSEDTFAHTSVHLPFSDIEVSAWYNLALRRAFRAGIIKGYDDGTFRPERSVSVAEASAMIIRAMDLESPDSGPLWYERFIRAVAERRAMPPSVRDVHAPITRGELTEILWRLLDHVDTREHVTSDELLTSQCLESQDSEIPGVDLRTVRKAWLSWYNDERLKRGLPLYTSEPHLVRSASIWSRQAAERGSIDHRRDGTIASYDYAAIRDWFQDLGLEFQNVNGITFTENVGRGPFRCSEQDCTHALIAALRTTFLYYLGEESHEYRPHFNAIVSPSFQFLGMGVAVRGGQYFVTTHFGTEIVSDPPRLCSL